MKKGKLIGVKILIMLATLLPTRSMIAQTSNSSSLIVNIDNPNFRKLVVALPKFNVPENADDQLKKLASEGAEELARLLTFSGLFNVMADSAYNDILTSKKNAGSAAIAGMEGVDPVQWKSIGVESLTVGELKRDGDDLALALRTGDIYRSKLLLGKQYTKVPLSEFKMVLRRYADHILQAYTGKPGIFSTKIVFIGRKTKASDKQVYICDFDGSNVKQITHKKTTHVSPVFSPDGKYVTYTSYEDGNPDMFIYEVATGKTRKLSGRSGLNSGSNWAPNGKLVAFTGSANGDTDIFVIKPDGKGYKPFIRGAGLDVDPTFSPDGKWLAFVSGRFGNPHIFIASLLWKGDSDVTATGDKRLTYAGWYNATPAWTPESDKLAFAGYDKEIDRFDIFMVNPDGSQMERLTIRMGDNERPSWAPNGQILVFQTNRLGSRDAKGPFNLYVMNRDGSGQRKIDTGLYESQQPFWGPPLQ